MNQGGLIHRMEVFVRSQPRDSVKGQGVCQALGVRPSLLLPVDSALGSARDVQMSSREDLGAIVC